MENQLEPGAGHTLHHALSQDHPCLSWAARYKIALDMASSLAFLHTQGVFIHTHGELKPSDIFFDPEKAETGETTKWRCVEGDIVASFGKVLYALISAKESGATLPSSVVGDLGKGENMVFQAALWLRRHTIPPLPWACPLRRHYILNGVDGRVRNEIMSSGRAIVQLSTAIWVVVQCTQDDPGSRPTMAMAYTALAAANSCAIPWSLTVAVSIGFRLYRFLATLVYVLLFLYVGIYKSLGLLVYCFTYGCAAYNNPAYDPLDALILLFSLLALMWFVFRTVYSMNRLDDVLFLV